MTKRFIIGWLVVASALATGAAAQQPSGALGRIKAAKEINVAYSAESLPFRSRNDNQPAGYSIDLCSWAVAQSAARSASPTR
jgi:ABC-type amino acid transport substrate-binding protein